jgi:uncharacterized membrane protein YidH (DUF202 family)
MNKLEKLTQQLNRNVEPMDDLAGALESIALTIVSRLASWAASIPNVLMVSRSAVSVFDVEQGIALTIAISLELIGQSLTAHWRKCKNWNASKRKADLSVNVRLALGLMVAYFVIDVILVFCLALATYSTSKDPQIFLSMAYPAIGIVTAIITNERAALFRMQKARQIEKQDRAEKRNKKTAPDIAPVQIADVPFEDRARSVLAAQPEMSGAALASTLGCSGGYARRLKREIQGNGNGHKTPVKIEKF